MSARALTALALVSTVAFASESMAFDAVTPQTGSVGSSHTLDCGDASAPLFTNGTDNSVTVNVEFESQCGTGGYVEKVNEYGRSRIVLDLYEAGSDSALATLQPGQEIWAGCGTAPDREKCCFVDISILTPID